MIVVTAAPLDALLEVFRGFVHPYLALPQFQIIGFTPSELREHLINSRIAMKDVFQMIPKFGGGETDNLDHLKDLLHSDSTVNLIKRDLCSL